jgi:hypothetical protein
MIALTRRQLFNTTSLGALAVGIAGCSQLSSVFTNLPQYAQDVQNLAAAPSGISTTVGSLTGIPASVVSTVQSGIASVQSLASQIVSYAQSGAATVSSTLVNLASEFSGALGSIVNAVGGNATSGVSGLGTLGTILNAGLSILPEVLGMAGIALAGQTPMDIVSARKVLAALAAA